MTKILLFLSMSFLFVGCVSNNFKEDPPAQAKLNASDSSTGLALNRKPAEFHGVQSIGNTSISIGAGGSVISGPNGVLITTDSTDSIGGTWSDGINLDINRVISGTIIPSKIVVDDFELKMPDGKTITILALTSEENKLEQSKRSEILYQRAQEICDFTKTHRYIYAVETKTKIFSGLLIDLVDPTRTPEGTTYKTYPTDHVFSGSRYFSKVICGQKPRGY